MERVGQLSAQRLGGSDDPPVILVSGIPRRGSNREPEELSFYPTVSLMMVVKNVPRQTQAPQS